MPGLGQPSGSADVLPGVLFLARLLPQQNAILTLQMDPKSVADDRFRPKHGFAPEPMSSADHFKFICNLLFWRFIPLTCSLAIPPQICFVLLQNRIADEFGFVQSP